METLLIAVGSFVGFIVAYHTYGKWLANKIFVVTTCSSGCDGESNELARSIDDTVQTKNKLNSLSGSLWRAAH